MLVMCSHPENDRCNWLVVICPGQPKQPKKSWTIEVILRSESKAKLIGSKYVHPSSGLLRPAAAAVSRDLKASTANLLPQSRMALRFWGSFVSPVSFLVILPAPQSACGPSRSAIGGWRPAGRPSPAEGLVSLAAYLGTVCMSLHVRVQRRWPDDCPISLCRARL